MASLLPDSLIDANKQPASNKDLKGKVIGLYFSAHWCPPCRGFTPKLCEWYANFKKTHEKKDDFELVFVSSDRDEQSFKEYHNEMNFWAVPFANRDAKVRPACLHRSVCSLIFRRPICPPASECVASRRSSLSMRKATR
jgi:nucleoredoxin